MRKEQPGKRTDPGKLAKEREKIQRSKEDLAKPKESTYGLIMKVIRKKVGRRMDRSAGYGPAPQVEGAAVIGERRPRGDA